MYEVKFTSIFQLFSKTEGIYGVLEKEVYFNAKIEIVGKGCSIIQMNSKYQKGADIYTFSKKMLVPTNCLS